MYLATRLNWTIALFGLLVVGLCGAWLVHAERHDFDRAVDRVPLQPGEEVSS